MGVQKHSKSSSVCGSKSCAAVDTWEKKKPWLLRAAAAIFFSHSFITSGAYLYFRVARPSKNNSQCGVRCHNDQIMNTIWQSNKVCMQDRRNCYKMDIDWPSLSQQGITRWRVSKWLWSDACPITWSPITCPALFFCGELDLLPNTQRWHSGTNGFARHSISSTCKYLIFWGYGSLKSMHKRRQKIQYSIFTVMFWFHYILLNPLKTNWPFWKNAELYQI